MEENTVERTPGPWSARDTELSGETPSYRTNVRLCQMARQANRIGCIDHVSKADLALILAAPSMLAALEAIRRDLEDVDGEYGGMVSPDSFTAMIKATMAARSY